MALVPCPECGRENISDSAASCPVCGYRIKEYYEQLAQEKERQDEIQRQLEKLPIELDERLLEIDKMIRPYKPQWTDMLTGTGNWIVWFAGLLSILFFVLMIFCFCIGEIGGVIYLLFSAFLGAFTYVNFKQLREIMIRMLINMIIGINISKK